MSQEEGQPPYLVKVTTESGGMGGGSGGGISDSQSSNGRFRLNSRRYPYSARSDPSTPPAPIPEVTPLGSTIPDGTPSIDENASPDPTTNGLAFVPTSSPQCTSSSDDNFSPTVEAVAPDITSDNDNLSTIITKCSPVPDHSDVMRSTSPSDTNHQ